MSGVRDRYPDVTRRSTSPSAARKSFRDVTCRLRCDDRSTGGAADRRHRVGNTSNCHSAKSGGDADSRQSRCPDDAGDDRARHAVAAFQPIPAAAAEGTASATVC